MKSLFFVLVLWLGGVELFGMEELVVEDDASEMFASVGSQMLLGVLFVAPAVAIGSLFALMRFDKVHKAFLQDEIKLIDKQIDKLREECMKMEINPQSEELYKKLENLKKAYERV